jgi:DNA-nicking Smr family endonuclease
MKRPPLILDPSVMPRRRRALSEEERALWESVARQIKPLSQKPRAEASSGPRAEPVLPASKPTSQPLLSAKLPRATKPPPPPKLGRRERTQLSRGRKAIEARLDLHGMTQARAHRALLSFLQRASSEGLAFVLVITGKGGGPGPHSGRGVLRRQVPEWLGLPEFRALVIGFEQAHIAHGGEGALYVRVRRAR